MAEPMDLSDEALMKRARSLVGRSFIRDSDVTSEYLAIRDAATVAEQARLRQTLIDADSHLSLLRYRCASTIPWGTVSAPKLYEVEKTIGELRRAYEVTALRGGDHE